MRAPRHNISAWFCSSILTRSFGATPILATTAAAPPMAKSAATLAGDLADVGGPVEDVVVPVVPVEDGALGPTRWSALTY